MRSTRTLVIGAGQAGLALSWHLTQAGHAHAVLERGRVGERWRSERWESLTLLTPNWLNRLPGSPPHADPDGFLDRRGLVGYLERYARSFSAPVHERVTVLDVSVEDGGFRIATDHGLWRAENVVIATGDCDVPRLPGPAAAVPDGVEALHASRYRSPDALGPGGVLVVGAGPTGQQLALELRSSGRQVALAVGRHARLPRRYRGRDIFSWLAELGDLDRTIDEVPDPLAAKRTPSVPLRGTKSGQPLDLPTLADAGVTLVGRLTGFAGSHALFAGDLADEVADAERRMRRVLARIDRHIESTGASAPAAEPLRELVPPPPRRALDLRAAGISTVLFATGYRRTYPWLPAPVLGADGEIVHEAGVTSVPGLYVLGLRFQRTRKSHFLGGVGEDAGFVAAQIVAREARLAA